MLETWGDLPSLRLQLRPSATAGRKISHVARSCDSQQKKKKRPCRIVDFAVPADHRIKLKGREKRDNISRPC